MEVPLGFASRARYSTAAPVAGRWHLPTLRPAERAVALLSSACAVWFGTGHEGSGRTCAQTGQEPRDLSRVSTADHHHRAGDQRERQ